MKYAWLCLLIGCAAPADPDDDDSAPTDDDDTVNDDDDAVDDDDSGDDDDSADDDDATPDPRPNILLILADDFGKEQASFEGAAPCYDVGNTDDDAPMPNLAELCAEGLYFRRAWSLPVCSPTRASILTGRLPHDHGVGNVIGASPQLGIDEWTLPQALDGAGAGYDMASIGKWHITTGLDDPRTMGWHHYAGVLNGVVSSYTDWTRTENGIQNNETEYVTTQNVQDSLDWLDDKGDAPWFLWLAFTAPHSPWHKPPEELQSVVTEDYDENIHPDPHDWYIAAAQAMDTELGRLFDELRARGEWDETVVIFLGDNGSPRAVIGSPYAASEAKGTLRQGGINVPMVVRGPGVKGGRSTRALATMPDLFATVLDLAELDPQQVADDAGVAIDGVSLVPVFEDAEETVRDIAYSELFGPAVDADKGGYAARNAEAKLICHLDGTAELYDMSTDRFESVNLLDPVVTSPVTDAHFEPLRDVLRAQTGDSTLCP